MSVERSYLLKLFGTLGAISLLAAAISALVDPYRLLGTPPIHGVNEIKSRAGAEGAASKALAVEHLRPRGLILGNSRAEVGLDPGSTLWPNDSRPIYNLALPGTDISYSLRYLQHALAVGHPRTVVLGIDFLDFLVDSKDTRFLKEGATRVEDYERYLAASRSMAPNPSYRRNQLINLAKSLFSLDGLWDALITIADQHNPNAPNISEWGFNPMRDYAEIAKREGYASLFRQKDSEYIKSLLKRPKALTADRVGTSEPLEELRQIILLCQSNQIDLRLVIYPYHAHFLESLAMADLWPLFEEWKGRVVTLAGNVAANVTLYDFSGYHEFSTEVIPEPNDRRTVMQWYWESGHFTRALGDRMLERVFSSPNATNLAPGTFGVILSASNLPAHLAAIRADQDRYQREHAADVEQISALFNRFARQ